MENNPFLIPWSLKLDARRLHPLLKTLQALIQAVVNLENIMELQEFEKFHHLFVDVTYLKYAIIIIGGLHNREEDSESWAVNESDATQVKHHFNVRFIEKIQQFLFNLFGNKWIKPVGVNEGDYINIIDILFFQHLYRFE